MNHEKQPEALRLADQLATTYTVRDRWNASHHLRYLYGRVQELEAELVKEAARTAEEKLRADQVSQQHSTQASLNSEARKELAEMKAQQAVQPVVPVICGSRQQLEAMVDASMSELATVAPLLTRSECKRLILAALSAPAHHAEGVPGQDAEAKIEELLALARIMVRTALDADNKTQVLEIKAAIESEVAFERALRAALANTQPAAQGIALDAARYRWLRRNIGVYRTNDGAGPVSAYLLTQTPAKDRIAEETDAAIDAALAAQAKQGEA